MSGKTCKKCGVFYEDPRDGFHLKGGENKFASACKECTKKQQAERRAKNPELARERKAKYNATYNAKHRERILQQQREYGARPEVQERKRVYMKEWRKRNPEYDRGRAEIQRMHRLKNADHYREYRREWEKQNKERRGARKRFTTKMWRARNPDSVRLYEKIRRARKRASVDSGRPRFTAADVEWRLTIQKRRCYWCGSHVGQGYHIDHIIPLARGGSNSRENICIACAPCNLSKGAKMPEEFAGRFL